MRVPSGPPQKLNHLNLNLLLDLHESVAAQAFSLPLNPGQCDLRASAQSNITSSSSSADLLRSLVSARVKIFPGLYNFSGAYEILVFTPLAYALHVDTPLAKHTIHATYATLPLRKQLRSVYFRK